MQLCSSAEGGLAVPSVLPQATSLGAYKRKAFFCICTSFKGRPLVCSMLEPRASCRFGWLMDCNHLYGSGLIPSL